MAETVKKSPVAQLAGVCGSVALGYLLIHLEINLGTLDILPDWVGFLLMVEAIGELAEQQPSARLLRPLGLLLAAWNFVAWVDAIFSIDLSWGGGFSDLPVLALVIRVVSLYFHFQLLTNIADAAEGYIPDQCAILRRRRTMQTLFLTLIALPLPWTDEWFYASLVLLLATLIVAFTLWWQLRVMKAELLELDKTLCWQLDQP